MTTGPEHEEVAELLGAYVLDAVEDHEVRRIEHHLAECPQCRTETDRLRQVAAALGSQAGLEGAEPPPGMWNRIADRIGAGASAPSAGAPSAGAGAPGTGSASVIMLDEGRRRKRVGQPRWAVAIAAAAAAAIAALAVGLVHAEGRANQLQAALAGKASDAAVRAALTSPGHRILRLRTSAGTSVARLVLDRNGVGYVVGSAMSSLPTDETYQLWASIEGRAISLGLLGPNPSSGAAFSLGSAATSARELMVTVESAGGVVTPDRAPIATAVLRSA